LPRRVDPAGVPGRVAEHFPHLAAYDVLRLPTRVRPWVRRMLRGQVVVAAYDAEGALVAQTGLQIPGVLDGVYRGASDRSLGITWGNGTAVQGFALHPVQAGGADPVVTTSTFDPATGAFSVSARTVAVFVRS